MLALLGQSTMSPFVQSDDVAGLVSMPIENPPDPFSLTFSSQTPLNMSSLRMSTSNLLSSTGPVSPSKSRGKPPLGHSFTQSTGKHSTFAPSPRLYASPSTAPMSLSHSLAAQAAVAVYNQHYQGLQVLLIMVNCIQ